MKTVNMHEAKTHLSRLVEAVERGEEVLIAKAGKPVARLVKFTAPPPVRKPGSLKGKFHMSEDFDAPLPPEILADFGIE